MRRSAARRSAPPPSRCAWRRRSGSARGLRGGPRGECTAAAGHGLALRSRPPPSAADMPLNSTVRRPFSPCPTTSSTAPWKSMNAPVCSLLPGRAKACQRQGRAETCRSSRTSAAPAPRRRPSSLAGITRLSLTTRQSPLPTREGNSRNDASRQGAGAAVDDEHAAFAANFRRFLRDQCPRQIVVERRYPQRYNFRVRRTWFRIS